jgi:hypothetical protein
MGGQARAQIIRITTGFLNTVDDVVAGGPAASGTGANQYEGQLGKVLELDAIGAAARSDTSVATLYGGIYQYVRTKAGSTIAPARCLIASRDVATAAFTDYVVTPDLPTGNAFAAGIYLSALTKGQFGFIQVAGIADVQGIASFAETPAVGDLVFLTTGAVMDNLAGATAVDPLEVQAILGVAEQVPADGAITRVLLGLKPVF